MAQKDDVMRNLAKIATAVGLGWIAYKVVKGLSNNQTATQIVSETVKPIENVASEIKKTTKKLLKGSPEAKARMAALREKGKGVKRGEGKRAKRKKSKSSAVEMKESNSSEQKSDKVNAGEKGGEATAALGKHKGHSSKKGLVADQKKTSKEKHEKHYRKTKSKR